MPRIERHIAATVMALLAALVLVACARATPTTRPTPWAYKGTVGLAAYPDIATVVVGEVLEMSGEEVLPLRDSPDSAHYGYWRLKVEQYLVDPFPYSELKIKQLLELIRPDGSTAPVLYPTYVRLAPGERAVFYLGRRSLPIEEPPVTGDTFTLTVGGSESKRPIEEGLVRLGDTDKEVMGDSYGDGWEPLEDYIARIEKVAKEAGRMVGELE